MSFIVKHIPRAFIGVTQRYNVMFLKSRKTEVGERNSSTQIDEYVNKYLKLAFAQADRNKDGLVSAEEMKKVIKMFFVAKGKPENPMVNAFFEKVIFQGNHTLSEEELLSRVDNSLAFVVDFVEDVLKAKFSHHDVDKDGKLTKAETGKLLDELYPFSGNKQVEHVMSKFDKDKDGNISLVELLEFAKKEIFTVKL